MYAQSRYSQKLGTGPYTIAEAGCFLTAFCNLLERFGNSVDPISLNNYFIQHGKYIDVDRDNTMDDLAWGTVTSYDGLVAPVGIGGAGWPDSNDAIVKFVYKSKRTGLTTTHFCLVADHNTGAIVDSWDGVIKASPYGTPVAWAKYERHAPHVVSAPPPATTPTFTIENIPEKTVMLKIDAKLWDMNQRTWPALVSNPVGTGNAGTQFRTAQIARHALGGLYYLPLGSTNQGYNVVDCQDANPAPVAPTPVPAPVLTPAPAPAIHTPPSGPLTISSGRKYTVIVPLKGYRTATQAGNHDSPASEVVPGEYFVFNVHAVRHDLINVTSKNGVPGSWINTNDNVVAPPTPPPAPEPVPAPVVAPTPPPEVLAAEKVADQLAAATWQDSYKQFPAKAKYSATRDLTVTDLTGQRPAAPLKKYEVVTIFGTVQKDGIDYYRAFTTNDPQHTSWYCIPKIDPETKAALLLLVPTTPLKPVTKVTNMRDTVELAKARIKLEAPKFLDDILPKWLKNKK